MGGSQTSIDELLWRSIEELNLSVRSTNCLKIWGIERIGDLVARSQTELLRRPNLGAKSLQEIEAALASQGLRLGMAVTASVPTSPIHEPASGLVNEADDDSVESVAGDSEPETELLKYLSRFDDRERSIIENRIFDRKATLEEVGAVFGVTRERIRQIEKQVEKKLQAYKTSVAGRYLREEAAKAEARLGLAVPKPRFDTYWQRHALQPSLSDAERRFVVGLLLWVAGPYRKRKGWMIHPSFDVGGVASTLRKDLDERGCLSRASAGTILDASGVATESQEEWLRHLGYRVVDGAWLPRMKTIPDQAEQWLRYRGRPVTARDLLERVRCESERSLRQRLLDDRRFKRVSRQGHFALREWDEYEEYDGIAQEIAQEIRRYGGEVEPNHVIATLCDRYGVKPTSVYQYLAAPMFARTESGAVRLRGPDEPLQVNVDRDSCGSLYRHGNEWTLRIEVTTDTLRGSGRLVPVAVAELVDCGPGRRVELKSKQGIVVVSWPATSATGPNLGSVKPEVEALGGQIGDFVFLTFVGGEVKMRLLKATELEGQSPLAKLMLLVGLPALAGTEAENWREIGAAIGLQSSSRAEHPENIHAQLMRRNEVDLAELAREAYPNAAGDIFEQLEHSLGL